MQLFTFKQKQCFQLFREYKIYSRKKKKNKANKNKTNKLEHRTIKHNKWLKCRPFWDNCLILLWFSSLRSVLMWQVNIKIIYNLFIVTLNGRHIGYWSFIKLTILPKIANFKFQLFKFWNVNTMLMKDPQNLLLMEA